MVQRSKLQNRNKWRLNRFVDPHGSMTERSWGVVALQKSKSI